MFDVLRIFAVCLCSLHYCFITHPHGSRLMADLPPLPPAQFTSPHRLGDVSMDTTVSALEIEDDEDPDLSEAAVSSSAFEDEEQSEDDEVTSASTTAGRSHLSSSRKRQRSEFPWLYK